MRIEIHAADTIGKLFLGLTIPTWLKFSFSLTAWKSCPMADMKNGSTWSFAMHSAHIRQTMKTSLWLNLYNIPAIFRATPPKLVLIWPGLVPSAYVTKMIRQLQGRKTIHCPNHYILPCYLGHKVNDGTSYHNLQQYTVIQKIVHILWC